MPTPDDKIEAPVPVGTGDLFGDYGYNEACGMRIPRRTDREVVDYLTRFSTQSIYRNGSGWSVVTGLGHYARDAHASDFREAMAIVMRDEPSSPNAEVCQPEGAKKL